MKAFIAFWRSAMRKAANTIYWWIGLIFTLVGLIPLFPATWYGDWGRWLLLGVGLVIIFLWSPFKVWDETEKERKKLQAKEDSKKPNVELTNFDPELQYRVMTKGSKPVIVIRLSGRLRNISLQNSGSLDFFRIEVPTPRGSFIAVSNDLPLGYKFEPNSIYRDSLFVFTGDLGEPAIQVQSWEPFIKGAKGRVNLAIQGQEIRSYPIKIADQEGF
jgi:hypothetical protein